MKMPFGRYAGRPVSDVPPKYLRWLLTNVALSDALEKEVEAAIALNDDCLGFTLAAISTPAKSGCCIT